jgi:type IV secretory pathway VirJ component
MVLMVSGDGGWAGLDRRIAAQFNARGVPVAGVDSLRYFWNGRTPDDTAHALARAVDWYRQQWRCDSVLLVGYSFGADILPFVYNRLPRATRSRIRSVTLIGPSESATFEIHISNWLPGVVTPGLPLDPEIDRMERQPLCLAGADDEHSICKALPATHRAQIGSGHHLGGDAQPIVERILQFSKGA